MTERHTGKKTRNRNEVTRSRGEERRTTASSETRARMLQDRVLPKTLTIHRVVMRFKTELLRAMHTNQHQQ
ncbi:hypothetical protein H5410_024776, partial [Solanum commersonii]